MRTYGEVIAAFERAVELDFQTRPSGRMRSMSAKGSKADIWERAGEVSEVPVPVILRCRSPDTHGRFQAVTYGTTPAGCFFINSA
jgi:hypothetical protein